MPPTNEHLNQRSLLEDLAMLFPDLESIIESFKKGTLGEDQANLLFGWHELPYFLYKGTVHSLSLNNLGQIYSEVPFYDR